MGSETIQHKFVKCLFLSECWKTLRDFIENIEPLSTFESDHSLLNLYFTPFQREISILWLIGEYVAFVDRESLTKNRRVSSPEFCHYLRQRWLECKNMAMPFIGIIPGLFPSGIG